MGLRITTNVAAMNAHRAVVQADKRMSTSMERLSSGLRINRAADDATGLSIADKLRTQVLGGQQAAKNIQDGINLLNLADGGANEMQAILQRMRELAVQASNGTYTSTDRAAAQDEFLQLQKEITNISAYTNFNGIYVFLGAAGSIVTSGPLSTSASSPNDSTSVANTTTQNIAGLPTVAGNPVLTLPGPADVYGLGGGGPQSIVTTLINSGTGATITLPYGAGSWTYNAGTQQVTLASGAIPAGYDKVKVDYIKQGSLTNIPLTGTPIAGSEVVQENGAAVAPGGANGYSVAGNLLTINGTARPTATFPMNITAGYTKTGTTTMTLNTANPFTGNGATALNGLTFSVNGAPVAFTSPADYTLTQTQVSQVGNTPLYGYTVTFNNASIAAAAAGQTTVTANYTINYPTIVGPYVLTLQKGANNGDTQTINLSAVTLGTLGISLDDLSTQSGAMQAISDLDGAIGTLSSIRSDYGAQTNRLEHALASVTEGVIDQAAAESRIRDVDVAAQTSELTRNQILEQSATSVLQTSQQAPAQILRLLG